MSNEINAVSSIVTSRIANPQQEALLADSQRLQQSQVKLPKIEVNKEAAAQISQDTVDSIKEAVTAINDFMGQFQRSLSFSVDDKAGKTVIRVMDEASGDLIRQIPSEDFIKLTQQIAQMQSLLFSEEA